MSVFSWRGEILNVKRVSRYIVCFSVVYEFRWVILGLSSALVKLLSELPRAGGRYVVCLVSPGKSDYYEGMIYRAVISSVDNDLVVNNPNRKRMIRFVTNILVASGTMAATFSASLSFYLDYARLEFS